MRSMASHEVSPMALEAILPANQRGGPFRRGGRGGHGGRGGRGGRGRWTYHPY